VRKNLPEADILVIDDGSPDGTADTVEALGKNDPHIMVLRRTAKLGLGVAYIDAYRRMMAKDYEAYICMDADFSHDPVALPKIVEALELGNDFVIGSRYIPGGSTPDWKFSRRLISRVGNLTARTLLGVPIKDNTTGYRGYNRKALEALDFDSVSSPATAS